MKKKLLLVFPKVKDTFGFLDIGLARYLTGKEKWLLNSSLATVSALTPDGFEVKAIDENIEPIDFDGQYDLVGITGYFNQVERVKEISKEFSKRNVPVVIGGPSVTETPENFREFADVLILGEAERTWPQFIEDFLSGNYQQEYLESEKLDLALSPVPDYGCYSPFTIEKAYGGAVQTCRGCPYECEYCTVHIYSGRRVRYKPVNKVIQEIELLYKMGKRLIFLTDDNFAASRKNAKALLKEIKDWNRQQKQPIRFVTQATIDTAKDDEFLELAAEAGLTRLYIGIETPNVDSLKESNKPQNVSSNLLEDIKKIQQYGILVLGGSMVGFDHDDLSIFREQFKFFTKAGIPNVLCNVLYAPKNTPLHKRLMEEGRCRDSRLLNFIPKQMTIEQVLQGRDWLSSEFCNMKNFVERVNIFFKNYESSHRKNSLAIFKNHINRRWMRTFWRLLMYYIFKAPLEEKEALRKIFRYAKDSSHPQSFELVIGAFILAKNMQKY